MKSHYKIIISGKVQGVFYRASAQTEAIRLGINGFVKNELNGDVYLEIEATEEQLIRLTAWLWKGPDRAIVKNVRITAGELKNFQDFVVKR